MTRIRHTHGVERGLLRPLLGQTIVGLGYVVLGDPTNTHSSRGGISSWLSLVFTLQDGRQFELGEYCMFVDRDEPRPQFFALRIDVERLASFGQYWEGIGQIWIDPILDLDPPPPWAVAAISEVWVPMAQGADLIAIIFWGQCASEDRADRPALLAIDLHEHAPCSLAEMRALVERATLLHPSVIYRLHDPPPRRIELMADYTDSPICALDDDAGEVGNMDPEDLPLRPETVARLYAWTAVYMSWPLAEHAAGPTEAELAAFEEEGVALWQVLREELAGRYIVSYRSGPGRPGKGGT